MKEIGIFFLTARDTRFDIAYRRANRASRPESKYVVLNEQTEESILEVN